MDYTLGAYRRAGMSKRNKGRSTTVCREESRKEKKRVCHYIKYLRRIRTATEAVIGCACIYITAVVQTTDICNQSLSAQAQPLLMAVTVILLCGILNTASWHIEKRIKK